MLKIHILTLFPALIDTYVNESILKRAQAAHLIDIQAHNIRDYAKGRHRITDEPPFGGGGGMLLKPEPVFATVEAITGTIDPKPPVILLSPQGRVFNHSIAQELSRHQTLVFICGRYEGFDERIRTHSATDEISIGDFVLTGGELGALAISDAVARLIPGVLGADGAADNDSHATGLLEGPQYTKPATFRNWPVPTLLRGGDNKAIARWRREEALRRTWNRRPDMLFSAELTPQDKLFLATLARESA